MRNSNQRSDSLDTGLLHAQGRLVVAPADALGTPAGIALPAVASPVLALPLIPARTPKIAARPARRPGANPPELFESGEHEYIGDNTTLYFGADSEGVRAGDVPLTLENGLALTYGQVLALGGDFYGLPKHPISDAADPAAGFLAAYATLAVAEEAVDEVPQILAVMDEETAAVDAARLAGEQSSAAYTALGDSLSKKWNAITGGGSAASAWLPPGRYLKLAETNWDHFGRHAVTAYQGGHLAAMTRAIEARGQATLAEQERMLQTAYAINAFADHFLSDLFSSGHLRTPRKQLHQLHEPGFLTGLLARYMHDEDCMNGLYVENAGGARWLAYGDKRYADSNDAENAAMVNQAVQISADEVYAAFTSGVLPAPDAYVALRLIPDLDVLQVPTSETNYAPLFVPKGGTVYARQSYTDINLHEWTYNWMPPSTLAELKWIGHVTDAPAGYLAAPAGEPAITGWSTTEAAPPAWVDGREVRYAVSFYDFQHESLNESDLGPFCDYAAVDGHYQPTLEITVDPSGAAVGRRIYRQFRGEYAALVGVVGDNVTTTFTDTTNSAG